MTEKHHSDRRPGANQPHRGQIRKSLIFILVGFVCGFMSHGLVTGLFRSGLSLGVVDISDRPAERLTAALPLLPEAEYLNDQPGSIPAGSVLYPQTTFSEGFTRYILYVNVSDSALKAETVSFEHPGTIAPIWGEYPD